MYFNLIRQPPEGNAVRGKLYIADPLAPVGWRASSECSKRVVPAGRERGFSTLENLDYIIPPGTYPLTVTYSPKFKRMMPLICNVPKTSTQPTQPGQVPHVFSDRRAKARKNPGTCRQGAKLAPLQASVADDCVKYRSGIRIHPGTRPEHSRGCILVKSRETEEAIKSLIQTNNINQIEIL